jgi:predicted DNA binding protein
VVNLKLVEATILAKGRQNWITAITERYGAKLRLLQSKPSGGQDEVLQMFEIIVGRDLKQELLRYLHDDHSISEVQITNSSHGRLTGLIRAEGVISRCIADSDCFLVYASNEKDATVVWRVLGTDRSFKLLLVSLESRGIEYRISDMSIVSSKRSLTARQEWLLHAAFEEGYFDDPKKIHIRSLAKLLGVSPPTLHESLRKTQRKILEEHFRNAQAVRA